MPIPRREVVRTASLGAVLASLPKATPAVSAPAAGQGTKIVNLDDRVRRVAIPGMCVGEGTIATQQRDQPFWADRGEKQYVIGNFFSPYRERREIGGPLRFDCGPGDSRSAIQQAIGSPRLSRSSAHARAIAWHRGLRRSTRTHCVVAYRHMAAGAQRSCWRPGRRGLHLMAASFSNFPEDPNRREENDMSTYAYAPDRRRVKALTRRQ